MKTHARATFTTLVVLLVVFASGVLVGAAFDRAGGDERKTEEEHRESREERERRRTPMYERVGITDAQRAAIDSIMVHQRTAVRKIQREHRAAYDSAYWEVVDSTRAAILAVMNPDQRVRYDSLLTASDQRRRERESDDERN